MNDTNRTWRFLDPPNTAVITNTRILDGDDWVHYVTHDEEDGAWQFHPSRGRASMKEAAVVNLRHMLQIEPRLAELADLPMGWRAWRDNRSEPWKRTAKIAQ